MKQLLGSFFHGIAYGPQQGAKIQRLLEYGRLAHLREMIQ
jgi:hypothetical protein